MPDQRSMSGARQRSNVDEATVKSFGEEWTRYNQTDVADAELQRLLEQYFHLFPWKSLAANAEGFDMGCGSGRWAKFVAPRVGLLNCIDPSPEALEIARANLAGHQNTTFILASASDQMLPKGTQDFGYSLGVLHHVPDTASALAVCVELLKPGAPFLVYLHYRFDNRPPWFRVIWKISEVARSSISRRPLGFKHRITDSIAFGIYWPVARFSALLERLGKNVDDIPLSAYRHASLYTMRTDSRDRFGTPLEQRFTQGEIRAMMSDAGLEDIRISTRGPYWCAVGRRRS